MSSIEEAKAWIADGSASLEAAARALLTAEETVNEAVGALLSAVEGSQQPDALDIAAAFAATIVKLHEAADQAEQARSSAEQYSTSLG